MDAGSPVSSRAASPKHFKAPQPEPCGTGKFVFADGSCYEGEWQSFGGVRQRHGRGRLQDGPESYDGEWSGDAMCGEGVYTFATGAKYSGNMKNNRFDGQGTYTWPDGAVYEGAWREGRMHGDGCYTDADGEPWEGKFFNGKYDNGRAFVSLR